VKHAFVDPYCYPGTTVLKNLADIRDRALLDETEAMVTAAGAKLAEAHFATPHDLKNLLAIHRTLFGKLYPFAGKLREHTGRMTKTRTSGYAVVYCDSAFVPEQIALVFRRLAAENELKGLESRAFVERAAHFYGELDAVHPFREGNSRTLRLFFSGLARTAGFRLDWRILAASEDLHAELYAARDRAVMHGDSGHLGGLFHSILSPR